MFTFKGGESHRSLHDAVTSSVGLDLQVTSAWSSPSKELFGLLLLLQGCLCTQKYVIFSNITI